MGLAVLLTLTFIGHAEVLSFRNAHPLGWMHQLPVGETPGWTGRGWFNLEAGQANVWNTSARFTNRATNDSLTFEADFEQSTVVADFGLALSEHWALGVELPYANRNGGFMDAAIDQFHLLVGADRFLRNRFGAFGNRMVVRDGGVDQLSTSHAEGLGGLKLKLKHWWLRWEGPTPGACACGVGVSAQVKLPLEGGRRGLSSGHADWSVLGHVGVPIGQHSGAWVTAAYTRLGANDAFRAWPLIRDQRMLELSADLGLWGRNFGLVLTLRTESPLVDAGQLRFEPLGHDPRAIRFERVATGWNALTEWRGSQGYGVRWRWGHGQQINLIMTEDFGLGDRDGTGNPLYSNNAPDVAFISQLHLSF